MQDVVEEWLWEVDEDTDKRLSLYDVLRMYNETSVRCRVLSRVFYSRSADRAFVEMAVCTFFFLYFSYGCSM